MHIVQVIGKIESGTSIDVTLRRNGTNVGSANTVTTTKQTFSYFQTVTDGDALDLAFSNAVSSPADLGLAIVLEYVVSA
jgi:hypothetical protein